MVHNEAHIVIKRVKAAERNVDQAERILHQHMAAITRMKQMGKKHLLPDPNCVGAYCRKVRSMKAAQARVNMAERKKTKAEQALNSKMTSIIRMKQSGNHGLLVKPRNNKVEDHSTCSCGGKK